MTRTCRICGATPALHGVRAPGFWSRLPARWQGYRWACSAPCADELAAKRDAAMGFRPAQEALL